MAYKKKINEGKTRFHKFGIEVSWANDVSQEELEIIYNLGYTKFVEKIDKDDKKATKKSGKKQTKVSNKQDEQQD